MTYRCNTLAEGQLAWREDAPMFARKAGIIIPLAKGYLPEAFKEDFRLAQMAMDAQPALSTATNAAGAANAATDPSSLLALLAQITGSASGQANTTGAANSNFWGQIGTLLQNSGLFTPTPAPAPTPTGGN